MAVTNNLFVRDDLTDTGQIPSGARTYWTCPDIIPWQLQAVPDPQATFGTAQSYATAPAKDILPAQQNYIYLRAKNLYTGGAAAGTAYLYWCKSSLFINTDQWSGQNIPAVTGPGSPVSAAATGAIAVGASAFRWLAPPQPANYHYCIIARLVTTTPSDPNPIPPNFTSSGAFVNWIVGNPQVAFRNVYINSQAAPSSQFTYHISSPDAQAEQWIVAADTYNLPVNTTVAFSAAASGPSPPINVSGTVTQPSQSFATVPTTLPGLFEADLVVTVQLPGGSPWPINGQVKMRYYRVENTSNPDDELLAPHAFEAAAWGVAADASVGRLVRVGETEIVYA